MGTYTVLFLIVFPLLVAFILLVARADLARNIVVKFAALVIAVGSIFLAVEYFRKGGQALSFNIDFVSSETISTVLMGIEIVIALFIVIIGIIHKKYLASVFAALQTAAIVYFELTKGHDIEVVDSMTVDSLSIVMVLIIGIIGSLITVYALAYMKDFQKHHKGEKDRRPWFFFVMFLFLSAMFGIVTSNNLLWLYFFWEVTSLCSFFLIGYTKTKEATNNSFRALIMNLLGGVGFAAGIIFLGVICNTVELSAMLNLTQMGGEKYMVIPAALIAFAGLTKAAQMPFNSWLLGAMVAPTPTSALLHSSTMVKAGVFIILKLAPCLGLGNVPGTMVALVGGITFLMATFAAISQSNAKKVLAYSTIANLGLIVTCGGIGTPEAVWAGIMLVIFHAVTKSLLFLSVGTAEHNLGSRDIEDMDGLFGKMPRLATFMMIGIAGMFLAPFGMLISKWASLTAFVDSGNIFLIAIICFGSAATAFYWTKWLGKMSAIVADRENIQKNVHNEEWFVLGTHVVFVIAVCICFPIISKAVLVPYLESIFGGISSMALSDNNMILMVLMVVAILLLTVIYFAIFGRKSKKKVVPIYMAGVNTGDNLQFHGSMQKDVSVSLRNWHMEKYFGEAKMTMIGGILAAAIIIYGLGTIIGILIQIVTGGAA